MENPRTQSDRGRMWLAWPAAAALAWLGSVLWVSTQIGVAGVSVGFALSIVVAIPLASVFLWLGRWRRAPSRLLASAFIWGASVAAFCSIWSQQWLHSFVDTIWGTDVGAWVRPLIITPITEEALKALFLVWLLLYRRREITGILDGIVFAGLVGVGFSFTENSLYLGRPVMEVIESGGSSPAALSVLGVTIFMRVLLVPFFHSLMVAFTGIGVGIAANMRRGGARALPIAVGLLVALVLHGMWDFAGLASSDQFLIFKIYGAVMVPAFVAVMILSLVLRRRGARMVATGTLVLVRDGLVTEEEASRLASLRTRRQWRASVRRGAGARAARAVGRFQSEASALAIRVARNGSGDREQLAEQRQAVAETRETIGLNVR